MANQQVRPIVGRLLTPMLLPATRLWILGVVMLFVFSPTSIDLADRLTVVVLYAVLFFYPLSYGLWSTKTAAHSISYESPRIPLLLFMLFFQLVSISISTQYYTGSTIIKAFGDAMSGANAYAEYQRHFSQAAIGQATLLAKALYIVLLALAKLATVFFIANFFLAARRTPVLFLCAFASSGFYLAFGLARGTFFEVFELATAYAYFWGITANLQELRGRVRKSKLFRFVIVTTPIALVTLFVANALRRYDDTTAFFSQCSPNFCFDAHGFPFAIEYPLYLLTVYFGNGAYFLAKLYDATVFHGEWSYLIPFVSIRDFSLNDFGVRNFMCGVYVECKFVWIPEVATLISIFGILAVPLTSLIYSGARRFEHWVFYSPALAKVMTLYFVFLFLISLPVANFLLISSSSVLCLALLLFWLFLTAPSRLGNRRIVERA